MRKASVFFAAASILAFAGAGWASEPLSRAYSELGKEVAAKAAILRDSAAAKGAGQARALAGYCVAYHASGAEGLPFYFKFSCTNGVEIPPVRRWWVPTSRGQESFRAETRAMMASMGYVDLASFSFNQNPNRWSGYWVYRGAAAPGGREPYCLALRNPDYSARPPKTHYQIDCADGAVTELDLIEPGDGTSEIAKFMAKRDYEQVGGAFTEGEYRFSFAFFRRKPQP